MVPSDELEDLHEHTKLRKVLWAVIAAVVIIVGLRIVLAPPDGKPKTIGTAPSFSLSYLGRQGTLSDVDLRGKPVVLNLWASWCGPCRQEAKVFEAAHEEYGDRVRFVGVNVRDTRDSAAAFVEEYGITYPVVVDDGNELAEALGYYGLPETYFITADWRFADLGEGEGRPTGTRNDGRPVVLGGLTSAELEQKIEALLRSTGTS